MSNEKIEFEYEVRIAGRGGKFCLGSISREAGAYWSQRSGKNLASYIFNPLGHELTPSVEAHRLDIWFELNDLVALSGIGCIEHLSVSDANGKNICSLDDDDIIDATNTRFNDLNIMNEVEYAILCQANDFIFYTAKIIAKEPFDVGKLTFFRTRYRYTEALSEVRYDGLTLDLNVISDKGSGPLEVELQTPLGWKGSELSWPQNGSSL